MMNVGDLFPVQCSPGFVCVISMPSETAELRVSCDCGEAAVWNWGGRVVSNGRMLDEGTSGTRLAAQRAAQNALERRLERAGMRSYSSAPYSWKELLETEIVSLLLPGS